MMRPLEIFKGSDGAATTALYEALRARGPIGHISECLFKSCKTSGRAKVYRGRRYRSVAYENKSSAMAQVCKMLDKHGVELGFVWGWKEDPAVLFGERASYVLYVDIPAAFGPGVVRQVSYHSPTRGEGPDYLGKWDGIKDASVQRVIDLATYVLTLPEVEQLSPVFPFGKFRGQPISDASTHYIEWYEREVRNISPAFRTALNHELSLRNGSNAGRVVTGQIDKRNVIC